MARPAELTWEFACPDWPERLKAGRSLVPALPIDADQGERAVRIFNKLRLPDVADKPTMAEAAGDWFRDIVRAAFGSIDPESGRRRVGEVFALVPKKNSKTTGGAAIMLTAMLMNTRPRAEMLFVGPTQEIADTAFQQATGMVEADEVLKARFYVQEHKKTITDRRTKAKLKIKTFDMKVMTGSKPVVVLLDELHIMSANHYASRVIRQIRGGFMANPESLLIIITTQSDTPPAGAFKAELARARSVRDGRIKGGNLLPVLYEFPEAIQAAQVKPGERRPWEDPKIWPMVLPNLGRSITIEKLLEDYRTAQDLGESDVQIWASQHLNIEIGLGLHAARWRGADYWQAATLKGVDLGWIKANCDVAVTGIDGGGLDDLLALVVFGREKRTKRWVSWARAWAQSDVFDRRKDIAERLGDFVKAGDLVVCQHPTQDIEEVADIVQELNDAGLLPEKAAIGLDAAGVATLVDEIVARNVKDEQLASVPQGYRLTGAIQGGERKLKDGTWVHADQELMTWCVGNAKAEQRGNAVLITKETAGKAKIDPLIAAFNAFQLMSRNPEPGVGAALADFLANAVTA